MAAFINTSASESSQGTYLTASILDGAGVFTLLTDGLSSSPAGHSEDRFIDETLPAMVAHLVPSPAGGPIVRNVVFIGINRSPCTSQSLAGTASSNKGAGVDGCVERLVSLVMDGLVIGGNRYYFSIQMDVRNVYGRGAAQQAASSAAMDYATDVTGGLLSFSSQRTSHSENFMGTSAAKLKN